LRDKLLSGVRFPLPAPRSEKPLMEKLANQKDR